MFTIKEAREHLIVALDVPTRAQALDLVNLLKEHVGVFKVGLQLYTSYGPDIVESIVGLGCKVFLDLKLHDIPNTVANAVTAATSLGVDLLTIHTFGGQKMMEAAREAADRKDSRLKLLGVTVLTSLGDNDLRKIGLDVAAGDLVMQLAKQADEAGLDGIVCSPKELDRLSTVTFKQIFFVTPGIRPAGSSLDDQVRVKTPAEAITQGARYLVVGRPIIKASDPAQAAEAFLTEMSSARTGKIGA